MVNNQEGNTFYFYFQDRKVNRILNITFLWTFRIKG